MMGISMFGRKGGKSKNLDVAYLASLFTLHCAVDFVLFPCESLMTLGSDG